MDLDLGVLVALLLGVVPGIPGEGIYRLIAGSSWREDAWSRLFRIVGLSFSGFILYVLLAPVLRLPWPTHLLEGLRPGGTLTEAHLVPFAVTAAGQFVGGSLVAAAAGLIMRAVSRWSSITPYPDGWDEFVREYVPGHWVIVRLQDGGAYAGILRRADTSVPLEERDIILEEPAEFNEGSYRCLPYQYLFIPGESLASVAAYYEPSLDKRISPIVGELFEKEELYERNKGGERNEPKGGGPEGRRESETTPKPTGRSNTATPAGRQERVR